MVINSWLAALQNRFFSKKKPSRTRIQQSDNASQATQAAEGLEQRTLLTVNPLNDGYNLPELNEDEFYTQDASGGVLANDPTGNGPVSAVQVGSDPAFLLRPDGSFDFNAPSLPVLQTLQSGQTQHYLFSYAVNDNDGIGATAYVNLTVRGLNDPTLATNATQYSGYTEDQSSPIALGAIVVSDVDANDEITASLTLSNSDAGFLSAPGASFRCGVLSVTGTVAEVNAALASVAFTPSPDFDQDFTIGVVISDGLEDGTVAATGTIFMSATALPDAPVAFDSCVEIDEDSGTYEGYLWGYDVDTAPPASLTFGLTGVAATKGTVTITDSSTGAFTYTPNANENGTDSFQFLVTDETSLTSSVQTVTVSIRALNDPPTFELPVSPDQTVSEDSGIHVVIGFASNMLPGPSTATDEAGQELTFSVNVPFSDLEKFTSLPEISPAGDLTYTLAPDAAGDVTVTVWLHDNGGRPGCSTSAPQTFVIHITHVNDAPTFTLAPLPDLTVPEDSGTVSFPGFATNIAPGPTTATDETGQSLSFIVTVPLGDVAKFTTLPSINLAGELTFETAPDVNGDVMVTVTLQDDGGLPGLDLSAPQMFMIHIEARNDAPTFNLPVSADQIVAEDSGAHTVLGFASNMQPGPVTAVDESSQTFNFLVSIPSGDAVKFTSPPAISPSGDLTYTLAPDASGAVTVTVVLQDSGGTNGTNLSLPQTFQILITGINDAPSFNLMPGADQTVDEDAGLQVVPGFAMTIQAGPILAIDEATQLLNFVVNVPIGDLAKFTVLPSISPDGVLTYQTAPDVFGDVTVSVFLHDNGGLPGVDTSATQTFVLHITPLNDAPSFSLPTQADQTSAEDSGFHSVVGFATNAVPAPATATDEIGQSLVFHVSVAPGDLSKFSVAPAINSSGDLTYTLAPDAVGDVTVTVSLQDDGGLPGTDTSSSQTFVIHITSINDAPAFNLPGMADQTVSEDSGLQTVSGFATAIAAGPVTAVDESGQELNFLTTVSVSDQAKFTVLPSIDGSGVLTYQTAPDAHGDVTVTVVLQDDGGLPGADTSTSQSFVIHITSVNDAPTFTLPASGELTVLEDSGLHSIPGFATNIAPGPATATDEIGQGLNFLVIVPIGDIAKFTVQPTISSAGELSFQTAPDANGDVIITVLLQDDGGMPGTDTSASQTFIIHITSLNDAPTFDLPALADQTVAEDSGAQTVSGFATNILPGPLSANDEAGQELSFVVSVSNNDAGKFAVLPTINAAGDLSYTPTPNATGDVVVTVTLHDNGGLPGSDTSMSRTFTIHLTPVNDAPAFDLPAVPDQSILEDSGLQTVVGFASNITPGPSSATDESNQLVNFHVEVLPADVAKFSILPAISPAGTLTYQTAPDAVGDVTVTVSLHDDGGLPGFDTSSPRTFVIHIQSVNDAPSFTLPLSPDQSIPEDSGPQSIAGFATNITAGPASAVDETPQTLDFIVSVSNSDEAKFTVLPAITPSGDLTYTLAPDAVGDITVNVVLRDNGSLPGTNCSPPQTFVIHIQQLNDAPTFNLPLSPDVTVWEDAGPQCIPGFATNIAAGPSSAVDEAGQSLSFLVSVPVGDIAKFVTLPSISSTGELTYQTAPDANGDVTVTVVLQDGGGQPGSDTSISQSFVIRILSLNDAPTFALPISPDQTVAEDSGSHTVVGFATNIAPGPANAGDEAGQTVEFDLTVSLEDEAKFTTLPSISANGDLTYTLAPNAVGDVTVTVELIDNGGQPGFNTSAPQSFVIHITAINDVPSFDLPLSADVTVDEDAGFQTYPGFASNIAPGPSSAIDEVDQVLNFIVSVPSGDANKFTTLPSISPSGTLTFETAPDANGDVIVTVWLQDDGELPGVSTSGPQTFVIHITPLNDAPSFELPPFADQFILEDSGAHLIEGFASNIAPSAATATDEAAQTLVFDVSVPLGDQAKFAILPSISPAGDLSYTLAADAVGEVTVTITLRDNGGLPGSDMSAPQTFLIHICSINDVPTFDLIGTPNQTVLEDSGLQTIPGFATHIAPGPVTAVDEAGQSLNFIVSVNSADLSKFTVLPTISSLGELTYQTAPNANGDVEVTVVLHDDGGTPGIDTSAPQTFIIHIIPVNDVPVPLDDLAIIDEDNSVDIPVLANDQDYDGDALELFVNAPAHGTVSVNDHGTPGYFADDSIVYTPIANFVGTDSFTYLVNDQHGGIATAMVTVVVNGVNDAPIFQVGSTQVVLEDSGVHSVPGFATGILPGPASAVDEASQNLTFVLTNDNNSLFSSQPTISPDGTLNYSLSPNAYGTATVSVTLQDNGGLASGGVNTSVTKTFNISVTPVNDAPTFVVGANQTVLEDAPAQSVANWATAISAGPGEAGQQLAFHVTGNTNPTLFSVAPAIAADGTLTYTLAPNANGAANITITLSDNGSTANGGSDTSTSQTFTITATPVNDAPSFTTGADLTVLEDSGAQNNLGWATGIAAGPTADESSQSLTFQVTNNNPSLFATQPAIDATGNLTYTLAANAFGTATVSVTLQDNGGLASGGVNTSVTKTFNISVTPVNDAPTFVVGANQTVLEDAPAQSVANWATAISAGPGEAGQQLTFHVTGNTNPTLFSVAPAIAADGTLTYTLAPNANGSANITITLSDNGATANGSSDTSTSQTFTITATPVNDAPSFTTGADLTVFEDSGAQSVDDWATELSSGASNESEQSLAFTVTAADPSLFSVQPSIDPLTGQLSFTPAPDANGTTWVTVTLADDGGVADNGFDSSSSQIFSITIIPVNDAPSFSPGLDVTVLEDAAAQTFSNWAGSIASGPVNELGQVLSFTVVANDPSLFSVQPAIDAVTGDLTFTPAPDAAGTAAVTVILQDSGGTANGGLNAFSSQTFLININPVNDPPEFIAGGDQTVLEDSGDVTISGWASGILPGPVNESNQSLMFQVTAADPSLFSVQPAIDPVTGTLTFTPAPNAHGSTVVTVLLVDDASGNNTSTSQTFNIVIASVNDAPSFALPGTADQIVNEDAEAQSIDAFATGINGGPANEAGQSLTFNLTNDNNALFSVQPTIDPITGRLTYTIAANANGIAVVTVLLQDDGGLSGGGINTSVAHVFTITVNDVNDAPTFTAGGNQSITEDAGPQLVANWATSLSQGGATDELSQALNFVVTNDNNSLFSVQPTISADGTLSYTAASNAHGTATVTVRLHDNGGIANRGSDTSSSQTFTISVTSVNDSPVGVNNTFTIAENSAVGAVVGTVTATDADLGDTKSFAITGGNTGGTFAINSATGQITVANRTLLDYEANPIFHLTVTVTDGSNATGTASITVNLSNVDDPLTLNLPGSVQSYVVRGGVVVVDSSATTADQDTANINFSGGTLRVTTLASGVTDSLDRLGVISQGVGQGRIIVNGSKIYFESTSNQIGTIATGKNGGPLQISLTTGANQTAVNALLKAISFRNTSSTAKLGQRVLQFELSNAGSTVTATATKAVNVVNGKLPPVITLPGSPLNYQNASTASAIDSQAMVTDADSSNFDGGKLSVSVIQGINTNNRLTVLAVGGITLSGRDVLYNGTKIGRMTAGNNTLSVSLSGSAATPAATQALVRAIGFGTTSTNTNFADRVLKIGVTDGDGGSSVTVNKTIHVGSQLS